MGHGDDRPSVLVGVLHVGEPSLPRVLARIRAQVDVDVELLEIGHLPEREAHARLYAAFDAADGRHDALVKVDADMELVEPRLLHAIGMLFRREPQLDHIVLGVDDWFSGRRILGMNAWRNGIRWTTPPPELFTDLPTNTARTKLKVMDAGRPLVLHAADPTDAQAVRYGLHRGLKAVATGKQSRIARLLEVVDHAEAEPARGRSLAVAAIGLALTDTERARGLLDGTREDGVDLSMLMAPDDDPTLTASVRDRIERLASAATTTAASTGMMRAGTALSLFRRSVGAFLRGSRILRHRAEPRELSPSGLRADLIALLDA